MESTAALAPPTQIDLGKLLDSGRWSALQRVIVLLSALAIIFDGMDIQMMGFAIPSMAKEFGVAKGVFGPILAFGLVGVTLGTWLGGFLGDRVGRKKTLLGSMVVFGAATWAIAFSHSLSALLVCRILAGVGIGGALPNATTLTAEFTPMRRRALAVTLAIVCIPLGGFLAGLIAARVLVSGSWRTLFWIGGLSPILLAGLLTALLPESPRFLARHLSRHRELVRLLARIGMKVPEDAVFFEPAEKKVRGAGIAALFSPEKLRDTLSIWSAFFFCLVTVYLVFNWLPSILTGEGLGIKVASQGLAVYNLGGIAGALLFGWWISRRGSRLPLLLGSSAGLVTAVVLRQMPIHPAGSSTALIAALLLHGLFVNAVQTTMYALAAHIYTTRIRATGVAAALGVGRTGAILSAFAGSSVLRFGSTVYFTMLAVGMAGVFVALFFLRDHIPAPDEAAALAATA
jgi:AAHS family 4-hydroxybenzoate transporter-like MFS transporter